MLAKISGAGMQHFLPDQVKVRMARHQPLASTAVLLLLSASVNAQAPRLKVFVDCTSSWCDMNYFRSEINLVDFMLDRVAADVHVLITNQRNGSGGRSYQYIFFGQNDLRGRADTLAFTTDPNATDFEVRKSMLQYLMLGLAPLVSRTPHGERVSISMKAASDTEPRLDTGILTDPWNFWVFRVGGNGNLDMDQVYTNSELRGNVRAGRTTDDWKMWVGFFAGREKSSYEYVTDTGPLEVVVTNTSYNVENQIVRSLGEHWSYGYTASYLNSTFSNYKSRVYLLPQVEYSFFPYKDVNNRFLTFRYGVGAQHNRYYDTTIYAKTEEMLWGHAMELNVSFNQKWGTINSGISYSNYFHDWSLNNLGVGTQMEVRITGGLSVYVYLFGGLVHDQIYLPAEGASGEEVLSRQRQLKSSYNFESFFGLNYRFGSKLNNFVNPRFRSTFDDF